MTSDMEYLNVINTTMGEMKDIINNSADLVRNALVNKKAGLRAQVFEYSKDIQLKEEEVVEMCVQSLIRYQPFASDLRAVTVAMKVSYDLVRVCRYLYNIAEMQDEFNTRDCETGAIIDLFDNAIEMVRQSIKSYFDYDAKTAMEICKDDDTIDIKYRKILEQYKAQAVFNGECILFNGLTARIIERMADHACYISNEVIYMVTGRRTSFR